MNTSNLVQILNNAITQYYTSTTSGMAETVELINTLKHLTELTEEEEEEQIQPAIVVEEVVISSAAELSHNDEWDICEICYRHIYNHNGLQDTDRCDGVYFCTINCLSISKLKNIYCESCGGKFREDKMIDDNCQPCHKNYLNYTHNAQFAEIQAMMESAIDIEFIKSLKTRNGNTQTSEQIYIEKITDILRENNISFEKAGSQQPYDLRNVGNTGLLIEVKKTCGNTIIFNDTCPSVNVYYIVFITKSGKEKMLFIRGDEFIEDSQWIVEYTAEMNEIKDKYARGKNKKTGTMQVYPRPTYRANISKFM